MAATWDAAYCLGMLNRDASRPTADEITDATKYQYLTEGQATVFADVSVRAPDALLGAPGTMVTADNKVFTFGTDADGYPLSPMGKVRIFTSLASIPDAPMREGYDYLNEGTQIRIPNDSTYAGTLYWRGITPPKDIAAGGANEPSLFPPPSRVLLVNRAVRILAVSTNRPDLADEMDLQYYGDGGLRIGHLARWCLHWKTQFSSGGSANPAMPWWNIRNTSPA